MKSQKAKIGQPWFVERRGFDKVNKEETMNQSNTTESQMKQRKKAKAAK